MKKFILLTIVFFVISCNEAKKEKSIEEVSNVENSKSKQIVVVKKPLTISDYISFGDKNESLVVDDILGDLVSVKEVSLFKEEKSRKLFIVLKLNRELKVGLNGAYRIIARAYPDSSEDLSSASTERGLDFNSWYFDLYTRTDEQDTFIYGQVGENEEYGFQKILLQLVHLKTNKISPKSILIESIEAE